MRLSPTVLRFFEAAKLKTGLIAHPSPQPTRQIEFFTGDSRWNIDKADVIAHGISLAVKTEWLGGTWLDTAPLTYLARVCDVANQLLGEDWMAQFRKRLLNPAELLDILNELWWLGCWKEVNAVEMSPKAKNSGDNDWRITLANGMHLNLQVKRRRSDLIRLVHPTMPPFGLFDKLSRRFSASGPAEINVGVITIYAGIADSVLRCLDDYFRNDDSQNVDAVVLWSPGTAADMPPFFVRDRKSNGILREAFDLNRIDLTYVTACEHPISLNDAMAGEW